MSNIVAFSNANLPAVTTLAAALRGIESSGSGGVLILKMDKTGHWVFGADQTEVQDGSLWAINPYSFIHGYIAWGDGEVLGEKMVSLTEPLPELTEAPPGAKKGWEVQVGMSVKCVKGEDEGMEARYTTTSVGGKKAIHDLGNAIADQIGKDQEKPVALVSLGNEHYQHKSFGRIYTPIFAVQEWVSITGAPAADAPVAPAAEPAPARRRRPAA